MKMIVLRIGLVFLLLVAGARNDVRLGMSHLIGESLILAAFRGCTMPVAIVLTHAHRTVVQRLREHEHTRFHSGIARRALMFFEMHLMNPCPQEA